MWAPAPFPVALDGFGVQRGADAAASVNRLHVLADAVQQPAGQPQVVAHRRRANRPDLELPLSRHYLAVDAGNGQAGVQAGVHVLLHHWPAEHLVGTDAAVVTPLGRGEAVVRPAQRLDAVKEGVLLLDAEPEVQRSVLLGSRGATRPGVGGGAASCR